MIKKVYQKNYGKWGELVNHTNPPVVTIPADTVYIDVETTDGSDPVGSLQMYWFKDTGATKSSTNLGNNKFRIEVKVKDRSEFKGDTSQSNHALFGDFNNKIKTLNFLGFDKLNFTNAFEMFFDYKSLTSLDLSSFDTSNVTNMNEIFYNCSSLTSLDVSNFDTGNVTSMEYMFYGCSSLTSLDLSSFDTSNLTNMNSMFFNCSSLTTLDLSSWDTSKISNLGGMFFNCSSLTINSVLVSSSFDIDNAVILGEAKREWFTTDKTDWIGGTN